MIKIGTCVKGKELLSVLPWVVENGFETVELYFNETLDGMDFVEVSKRAEEINSKKGLEDCISMGHDLKIRKELSLPFEKIHNKLWDSLKNMSCSKI